MLIACLVAIALLIVFVLATFFITMKKYSFDFEGGVLTIKNVGSHLKIYFNEELIKDVFSPQLINGEKIVFNIGEKEYSLSAISNAFGNKLKIEIFEGEKVVLSNNVEIKEKKK